MDRIAQFKHIRKQICNETIQLQPIDNEDDVTNQNQFKNKHSFEFSVGDQVFLITIAVKCETQRLDTTGESIAHDSPRSTSHQHVCNTYKCTILTKSKSKSTCQESSRMPAATRSSSSGTEEEDDEDNDESFHADETAQDAHDSIVRTSKHVCSITCNINTKNISQETLVEDQTE